MFSSSQYIKVCETLEETVRGEGIIITTLKEHQRYLSLLNSQLPIES
jgi:hypothetical protein